MCAPIARNGSTIRRMGRPRRDSSPESVVQNGRPATSPVSVRMDVPELPQSTTSADAASASTPRPSTVIPEPATVIATLNWVSARRVR